MTDDATTGPRKAADSSTHLGLPQDRYGETAIDRIGDHAENGTMDPQFREDLRALLSLVGKVVPADSGTTFVPTAEEVEAIDRMSSDLELSATAVMRQALRLYQVDHQRRKAGETVVWSGDAKRAREFAGDLAGDEEVGPLWHEAMMQALDALKWANGRLHECGRQTDFTLGMCTTLEGSERRETVARQAMAALDDPSRSTVEPVSMLVPWHGGPKPADWDGKAVRLRSGKVVFAPSEGRIWKLGWDHCYGEGDVVAYSRTLNLPD